MVRRVLILTAVLLTAVIFFLLATLPPQPRQARWNGDPALPARTVSGAYHVHTVRSDGTADRAAVAAAAARAGLRFVIVTDHGDGTRAPEPPAYLSGVLCIDGVEISTNGGHYVALGLPRTPYPLGGEPSAVIEDVARLGGFGFAAHPDSPRPELAWTDWTADFDGIEWLNADTEWRNESRAGMARVLFDYFVRPGPALASMLDRPAATLARWDALATQRSVAGIAGHDAHGGIGRGVEDGGPGALPIPSYEASFRAFSTNVVLDAPLSGDAAADAARLLDGIRNGRSFTVIDAIAAPGLLDLRPVSGGILAEASLPPAAEMVLLRNGVEVATSAEGRIAGFDRPSGAFRVEVRVPAAQGQLPVPWLVSNPLSFLPTGVRHERLEGTDWVSFPADIQWHAEHDPRSTGTTAGKADAPVLTYELGVGQRASQFVALAADMPGRFPRFDVLRFDARASRPMRVSVQLRHAGQGGHRWGRSVYVSPGFQTVRIPVDDMLPLEGQTGPAPNPSSARSLLFVVDLTNAAPGDAGHLEISGLSFGRR